MKQELRNAFLTARRNLSAHRKAEAGEHLFLYFSREEKQFHRIASFSSMQDEIDLTSLNRELAREKRLLLPAQVSGSLQFYLVTDLRQLKPGEGSLREPDPRECPQVELSPQDLLLVPALAFDRNHFRLGYGKGCYDRFLSQFPAIPTCGVGFREQLSEHSLPRDTWDRPVQRLLLN